MKQSNGRGIDIVVNEKIEKTRVNFILDSPFFASIFIPLELREAQKGELPFPTVGTDGCLIIYDSDYVKTLPLDMLMGIFAHEVLHIVSLHHLRRGYRDPILWNIACDYSINQLILDSGFVLPAGCLVDSKYADMEAEAIYKLLMKEDKTTLKQMIEQYRKGKNKNGKEGASCGWVLDKKNEDGTEMTQNQKLQAEKEQRVANQQAAIAHEKTCGKLPGHLARLLGELNQPKINWKRALAQFVEVNSKSDYTWTLPNPRFTSGNIYLPRVFKPEIGTIVNLIDASGSVTEKELRAEVSELRGILSAYEGVVLQIIFFDTRATDPIEVTEDSELKKTPVSGLGGGTDYKPPFKKVEDKNLDPVCVICLTDGYCSSFPKPPDYPVLWILTQKNPNFTPPFGLVIFQTLDGDD